VLTPGRKMNLGRYGAGDVLKRIHILWSAQT
jgi:hypothetical protein